MKSVPISVGILAGIVILCGAASMSAGAQEPSVMTDEHIARIKSNCPGALSTLTRIHANDAPIFINRNQTYFSVSDKLMARLNSRLALNKYDTSQLSRISSDYNMLLTKLRATYKQYDDTMTDLLRINCRLQPVSFYDKVTAARELRGRVNTIVIKLKQSSDEYQQAVKDFKSQHFPGVKS